MRVALLSITDGVAGEPQGLRAHLTIGGRSLARHQLGLALALGCTRVVVMTEALTGEVMGLRHVAEAGGARFHVIASAHALLPLIAADDDLIVLGDGLLVLPDVALAQLEAGNGVLALPVEAGLAYGFERIDINHAYAGAMRLPGRVIAGLGDLPADWNPQAALLRLAVQARVAMPLLPAAVLHDGRWGLVRSEDEAHAMEPIWLRLHTASAHVRSPGEWIAATIVHRAGPALLHAGTRPWLVMLGGIVALLLALGSGWFGWRTPGFALLALAWVLGQVAAMMTRVERQSLLHTARPAPAGTWFYLALDGGFVVLAAWRSQIPPSPGVPFAAGWFAPLVLLLLLHFLPRVAPDGRVAWWLRDRLVAGAALAVASALLPFDVCLRLAVLGLLGWAIAAVPARAPAANADLTKAR